jgi:hypothetical protein
VCVCVCVCVCVYPHAYVLEAARGKTLKFIRYACDVLRKLLRGACA